MNHSKYAQQEAQGKFINRLKLTLAVASLFVLQYGGLALVSQGLRSLAATPATAKLKLDFKSENLECLKLLYVAPEAELRAVVEKLDNSKPICQRYKTYDNDVNAPYMPGDIGDPYAPLGTGNR